MTADVLVPTIDISPLFGTNFEEKLKVAAEIDKACRGSGFFFAANHGVDVLDDLVKTTRKFHQSMTEKEKWDLAIIAYNKENTTQHRNGYYLPIEGKKAVESYVSNFPSLSLHIDLFFKSFGFHYFSATSIHHSPRTTLT